MIKNNVQTLTGHETVFPLRYMDDVKIDTSDILFSIEWHRQNRGLFGPNDGLYRKN